MARPIKTVNGDGPAALGDYVQAGKIIAFAATTAPQAFPPKADFPDGGAFYLHCAAPLKLQTVANGPVFTIPAGYFPIAADKAEEYLLSAGMNVSVEVLGLKEKI